MERALSRFETLEVPRYRFAMVRALVTKNRHVLGSVAMNATMLLCCACWAAHASLVKFDLALLVPNAAGVKVQFSSLLAHFMLRNATPIPDSELALEAGSFSAWALGVGGDAAEASPLVAGERADGSSRGGTAVE